jgi:uncharacterized membrane protein YccC
MGNDPMVFLSVAFGMIIICLFVLMILQLVYFKSERRNYRDEIEDLRNRFMAKDFHDYSTGRHILNARPLTDVEEVEKLLGIDEEEKRLADRLQVT